MCRLFGMSAGARRARATFWLLGAPDSLATQSRREPDGTGLGWFDEHGRPQLRKQPIAAYGDADFAREAKEVCSSTFVAHIRFASTGSLQARNTHPFEQQGRLFAHNGVIEDLPALEDHLGDALAGVEGDTDSERLFALITREIVREGDVAAGIATACQWVAANLPLFAINLLLASEQGLWALRYPLTHELHILQREPGGALEHSSSFGSRVRSEHGANRPLVVVASEPMDDDPRWRMLESGELVHVDHALRVSVHRILQGPPARPLTLEDLGTRARASQAPGAGGKDAASGR
jgi:predicted glutamine amidotransferase